MAPSSKPMKIAGHTVKPITVGRHTVGQVVIDKNVTVLFRMADGGGLGGSDGKCLACKIGKISACAALVCPDIKKADPNASCSEAIQECAALACRGSCGGGGRSPFTDVIILA
jgi:hypothetical protein